MQLTFMKYLDKSIKFPKTISVGTDCSGIEAPLQALQLLNINVDHKFSCDNDPKVIASIKANYHPSVIYNDIMTRDHSKLEHVDLYIAGFPCQSFSLLGKRAGFNDPKKGTVFFECYETIKHTKPKIFILENVKGLINHDGGNTFKIIINHLEQLQHYSISYSIYNTRNYGLPQNRERLFIIGVQATATVAIPTHIPLEISVADLVDYSITRDTIYGKITEHKLGVIKDLLIAGKIDDINQPWCVNLNVSSYKRTSPMKDICPCLLAGNGGDCIYYFTPIKRRLTPREYLRIQGFPDSFKQAVSDSKMYKQVGNSMSTSVLFFIFQEIFRVYSLPSTPL